MTDAQINLNYGNNVGEYPHTAKKIIEYFGMVAVECVDAPEKKRLMGIALSVSEIISQQQARIDGLEKLLTGLNDTYSILAETCCKFEQQRDALSVQLAERKFVVELPDPCGVDSCNWFDEVKAAILAAGGDVR